MLRACWQHALCVRVGCTHTTAARGRLCFLLRRVAALTPHAAQQEAFASNATHPQQDATHPQQGLATGKYALCRKRTPHTRNRTACGWCACVLAAEKQRKMRAKHTAESLFFEKTMKSFQMCVSLSFFCGGKMMLVVSGGWKKRDFQDVRGWKKTYFQQECFVCGEIALPGEIAASARYLGP